MTRRGFTLIELLVVIAIIAILAAILFPVFAKAREKARQSSCLSNIKQIGLAFMQYKQDYDEVWPLNAYTVPSGAGSTYNGVTELWYHMLMPYCKNSQMFMCPSATYNAMPAVAGQTKPAYASASAYGWPAWHIGTTQYTLLSGVSDSQITNPSVWVCVGDADGYYRMTAQQDGVYNEAMISTRHNGGSNFAFCDGHGKWLSAQNVYFPSGSSRNAYWGNP